MQVSLALGRQLIMPPVWCGLDYGWGAHNGRMPGAGAYPLPFICPLGKVVDLEVYAPLCYWNCDLYSPQHQCQSCGGAFVIRTERQVDGNGASRATAAVL